ncbi:MAG: RNA polymerase sigma factor [Chloroflexota bacterium]
MLESAETRDLIGGILRREENAFADIVRAHQDRLFNFALRFTGTPEDAEEIVQDTFVKAYRALYQRLTPERVATLALTPWLYRIALNTARNFVRGRPARAEARLAFAGGDDTPWGGASERSDGPEGLAEKAEMRAALKRELLALPPRYRAAVILRLVQGLAYTEVAETLGLPVGTVKSHVYRGARLMRPGLARWWNDLPEEG